MSNPITELSIIGFFYQGKHHTQNPEDAKDYKKQNSSCTLPNKS